MLYRFIQYGEKLTTKDIRITDGDTSWLRPVSELRPVEDLTDGERLSLVNKLLSSKYDASKDTENCLLDVIKLSDEIRARPRETEKDKWIREYTEGLAIRDIKIVKQWLNSAYEAGMANK